MPQKLVPKYFVWVSKRRSIQQPQARNRRQFSYVSSLEYAKKYLDLAEADYGQAQIAQNTGTNTFGTVDTPLLN